MQDTTRDQSLVLLLEEDKGYLAADFVYGPINNVPIDDGPYGIDNCPFGVSGSRRLPLSAKRFVAYDEHFVAVIKVFFNPLWNISPHI